MFIRFRVRFRGQVKGNGKPDQKVNARHRDVIKLSSAICKNLLSELRDK